ncbi:hypothetical protein BDF20DRAFT_835662 [Mycotypha africana]|uniref:uncharacterized protein n=1 Tax=Mycotypha africana TaxID=64632 RepID=UPI002300B9B7|nr:uncharacterized protein BDF20DRAFT_835662 [Mycotypha africana]KAI8979675.1 hypothetical protein BDF20DRAFT_835662 [Mycotypha africana]
MIELPECYHVLGISHTASEKEIKRAYHREALKYHPDRNHDVLSNQRFQKINEAFETLTQQRNTCNDDDDDSDTHQFAEELFNQLFSNELKSFDISKETRTTTNTHTTATTTTTTTIKMQEMDVFSNNNSIYSKKEQEDPSHHSSLFFHFFPEYQSCANQQQTKPSSHKRPLYNHSSFKEDVYNRRCTAAKKSKLTKTDTRPSQKEINVTSPDPIRLTPPPPPPPTTTTSSSQPSYTRFGDNLFTTLHLSMTEALSGFKKQIPKFCSHDQYYLIENHHRVIQSGQIDVFVGQGVLNKITGTKGNLIVQYQVQFSAV